MLRTLDILVEPNHLNCASIGTTKKASILVHHVLENLPAPELASTRAISGIIHVDGALEEMLEAEKQELRKANLVERMWQDQFEIPLFLPQVLRSGRSCPTSRIQVATQQEAVETAGHLLASRNLLKLATTTHINHLVLS